MAETSGMAIPGSKKRRLRGACDICRRQKIRCDSAIMPDRCTNCIVFDSTCTHTPSGKRRRTVRSAGLEQRVSEMEKQFATELGTRSPDFDIEAARSHITAILSESPPYAVPDDPSAVRETLVCVARYARHLEEALATTRKSLSPAAQSPGSSQNSTDLPSHRAPLLPPTGIPTKDGAKAGEDGLYIDTSLADHLRRLTVDASRNRFFGKSSSVMLVKTAMDIKQETTGEEIVPLHTHPVRRFEYWNTAPWEIPPKETYPPYTFPTDDLLWKLVDLYFTHVNAQIPLLHRPSFVRAIRTGLHQRDRAYGATVLVVCALASRYSDDPRVFLEGADTELSAGWRWFRQVRSMRSPSLDPPTVYDLQLCCLVVLFIQGSNFRESGHILIAVGICYAQDVGAHRHKRYEGKVTAENELWKRAFWVLVCCDTIISATLGRPRMTTTDDYDLELPVEVDDEYWEPPDPEMAFKQPPDKPSLICNFNATLRLLDILSSAQRTIYSTRRTQLWFEDDEWTQRVVAELDSGMNNWIDSLPEHLRWNPSNLRRENNTVFMDQAAYLYANYYHVQIQIHRPFISSASVQNKNRHLSASSLAICVNAARSCSRVLHQHSKMGGFIPLPQVQMALFDSAVVLLLNHWGNKRSSYEAAKEMEYVHKCVDVLRTYEHRWTTPGRSWYARFTLRLFMDRLDDVNSSDSDIISALLTASDHLPPPGSDALDFPASLKRARVEEAEQGDRLPVDTKPKMWTQPSPLEQHQRYYYPVDSSAASDGSGDLFPLPMHTEALGSLPIHFDLSNATQAPETQPPMDGTFAFGDETRQPSMLAPGVALPSSSGLEGYPMQADTAQAPAVDYDTMAMWNNAPIGYNWADWGSYVSTVDALMQSLETDPSPRR